MYILVEEVVVGILLSKKWKEKVICVLTSNWVERSKPRVRTTLIHGSVARSTLVTVFLLTLQLSGRARPSNNCGLESIEKTSRVSCPYCPYCPNNPNLGPSNNPTSQHQPTNHQQLTANLTANLGVAQQFTRLDLPCQPCQVIHSPVGRQHLSRHDVTEHGTKKRKFML